MCIISSLGRLRQKTLKFSLPRLYSVTLFLPSFFPFLFSLLTGAASWPFDQDQMWIANLQFSSERFHLGVAWLLIGTIWVRLRPSVAGHVSRSWHSVRVPLRPRAWLAFLWWWQLLRSLRNLELFGVGFLPWIRLQVKPSWRRVLDRLPFEKCKKEILWRWNSHTAAGSQYCLNLLTLRRVIYFFEKKKIKVNKSQSPSPSPNLQGSNCLKQIEDYSLLAIQILRLETYGL